MNDEICHVNRESDCRVLLHSASVSLCRCEISVSLWLSIIQTHPPTEVQRGRGDTESSSLRFGIFNAS